MGEQATPGEITLLLARHADGDQESFDRVVALVYPELLRIARGQLRRQSDRGVLDTTALVNEAYLRLAAPRDVDWQNRSHFFAIAARAMRRVVVDYARKRCAQKRGGNNRELTLDPERIAVFDQAELMLDLDQALEKLSSFNERLTRIVECRFFAGMTQTETAAALGVSPPTVQRDWVRARAWLQKELAQ